MRGRAGFTLIETLAALAITSAIILSAGMMLHQSAYFFDYRTRTIDQSEQLSLAIDCLRQDFGSARFVLQPAKEAGNSKDAKKSVRAAFSGTAGDSEASNKILFLSAGGRSVGPQGEEIISLTVEKGDGFNQLVRRRAAWSGPRMRLDDTQLGDPIILLKGDFSISFRFSTLDEDGQVVWHDTWTGETGLPYSVRVLLRDPRSDTDLFPGTDFRIHADAPASCTTAAEHCFVINAKADGGDRKPQGQGPVKGNNNGEGP